MFEIKFLFYICVLNLQSFLKISEVLIFLIPKNFNFLITIKPCFPYNDKLKLSGCKLEGWK